MLKLKEIVITSLILWGMFEVVLTVNDYMFIHKYAEHYGYEVKDLRLLSSKSESCNEGETLDSEWGVCLK